MDPRDYASAVIDAHAMGQAQANAEAYDGFRLAPETSPLSGEWADGPRMSDILAALGCEPEDIDAQDLLDEWEAGYEHSDMWSESLTVSLDLGNDTMSTRGDVANALRNLARCIENTSDKDGSILDANGNRVGEWSL